MYKSSDSFDLCKVELLYCLEKWMSEYKYCRACMMLLVRSSGYNFQSDLFLPTVWCFRHIESSRKKLVEFIDVFRFATTVSKNILDKERERFRDIILKVRAFNVPIVHYEEERFEKLAKIQDEFTFCRLCNIETMHKLVKYMQSKRHKPHCRVCAMSIIRYGGFFAQGDEEVIFEKETISRDCQHLQISRKYLEKFISTLKGFDNFLVSPSVVRSVSINFSKCIEKGYSELTSNRMKRSKPSCKKCGEEDESKLKECSGCKEVLYCSDECQCLDWTEHEPSCIADGSRVLFPRSGRKRAVIPINTTRIYRKSTDAIVEARIVDLACIKLYQLERNREDAYNGCDTIEKVKQVWINNCPPDALPRDRDAYLMSIAESETCSNQMPANYLYDLIKYLMLKDECILCHGIHDETFCDNKESVRPPISHSHTTKVSFAPEIHVRNIVNNGDRPFYRRSEENRPPVKSILRQTPDG